MYNKNDPTSQIVITVHFVSPKNILKKLLQAEMVLKLCPYQDYKVINKRLAATSLVSDNFVGEFPL